MMAVDALPIGATVMAAVWMMTSWRGEDKAWLRGLIARGVDEAKREGSQMLTAIRLPGASQAGVAKRSLWGISPRWSMWCASGSLQGFHSMLHSSCTARIEPAYCRTA